MTQPAPPTQQRATAAAITTAYAAQTASVRSRLLAVLGATWLGLGAWRTADMDRFLSTALPMVTGAQRLMGSLTDAYLSRVVGALTDSTSLPVGLPTSLVTGEALRGVPPAEVYRRPFVTTWTALSNGQSLDAAVKQGGERLHSVAATDLQLAKTHSASAAMQRMQRVIGYRRVPDGTACALCLVASTQRYHRAELLPIHPGCGCDVEPLVGNEPEGQVIDRELLNRIHNAVREKFGTQNLSAREIGDTGLMYRDLIVTHHHGELGPVLAIRGQHFDGPGSIAA
jgi:hypothetical protein